ncbi:hypothetical protein FC34_GL001848 [Lacticaseibacillus brantae DSM 23927]|uniref:S-layer protein C-terminal domain-containing protein n=2 Tax=Lacticaseibacillus brantae TaxID=943673 RepID=A0A0R2AWJ4_9LACO|nr:hypothetical protein FC34_GL001848 [Lacticaseibacillus brantae DSM 23927]
MSANSTTSKFASQTESTAMSEALSTASQNSETASTALSTAMSETLSALSNNGGGNNGNGGNTGNGGNNGNGGSTLPNGNGEDGYLTLNNAIATIVQRHVETVIYDKPNGKITNRELAEGTDWKAFQQYTDANGLVWYNLGGNQWIKSTGVILDAKPFTYKELSKVGVVKPGTSAPVYSLPGVKGQLNGQVLKAGTAWHISASVYTNDGTLWYRVGTNQWVKAEFINLRGEQGFRDVATIKYAKGYGIAVWTDANESAATGKKLEAGSSWQVFGKTVGKNGHTFYNIGGKQWIDGTYVILRSSHSTTVVPKSQTTIKYVPGYGIKTWQSPTSKVSGETLLDGQTYSVWATEVVNNNVWYQVGDNQWIQGKFTTGLR